MGDYEEIDIMDVVNAIWKSKIVIAIILLLAIIFGNLYTNSITPQYRSTVKILIDKTDASIESMINNEDIVNATIEKLGISNEEVVESRKALFDKNTKTITLTFTNQDAQLTYQMVNAYIEPLKVKLEEIYNIKLFTIMQEAEVPIEPYNINHLKNIIIAIGIGIILIGAYILIVINRKGISKVSAIENNGLILLGKIKQNIKNDKKTVSYVIRDEEVQEDLRKIIAKIEFNKNVERPKAILFTGIKSKIGNSYVVSNIAFKNAKLGKKVLMIDANLNKPIQHKIFNVNENPGLTDLLATDDNNVEQYIIKSSVENLSVLPHGTGKVEEILNIDRFIQILQKLKNKYDMVLIDGMPIMEEVLSIALANIVDATVIIVEFEKTKIEDLQNTKRLIEDINGKIAGVIMNRV